MQVPPDDPTMGRIFALRPPSAAAMRADLEATAADIAELLKLDRAPTFEELAALKRKLSPPTDHAAQLPTLAQRVAKLKKGVGSRLPMGFGTLDLATRGGIPRGKRMVLVGAPGAAKTFFALAIAQRLLTDGAHVAIHAADEDLESVLVRVGQAECLSREDLEEGNEWALGKLAELLERDYERLLAVDQDEDGWTLEDTAEELLRRAQGSGAPMLLIIDSIQTVTIRGPKSYRSKREEIDAVVKRIKHFSARGIFVIATSEMNRRGYGAKKQEDQVDDLASAAESRSIEFAAHILISLKSVKDEDELVIAAIAKNRLGKKLKFRLKLNFDRATLEELPPEEKVTPENEKAKAEARRASKVADIADLLFEALLKQRTPVTDKDQLRALVNKGSSDERRLAIARLQNEGRIAWEKTEGKKGRWRAVTASSATPQLSSAAPSESASEGASNACLPDANPMPTHSKKVGTQTAPKSHTHLPTLTLYEVKGRQGGLGTNESQPEEGDAHPTEAMATHAHPMPTRSDDSEDPS